MAKTIDIEFDGESASFAYKPIDRKSLYGYKKRVAFDNSGKECIKASLLEDGSLLLKSGMSGQGYFTEDGTWVATSELEAINIDGSKPELFPPTIGVSVKAKEISAEEALNLKIVNTYSLEPEVLPEKIKQALDAGKLIAFPFNPRADYNIETGVLVSNENGYFALIGNPVEYQYTSLETKISVESEIESQNDELDFEMF